MEWQPLEDVTKRRWWEGSPDSATIKLAPDFSLTPNKNSSSNCENKESDINELKFDVEKNHLNPEARRGFERGSRYGSSTGNFRKGSKNKRAGGPTKRHPNFAARNRKRGKGGPTGRGAFSGLKKRRPTAPSPPPSDDSDYDPLDHGEEVDMKTGKTKRRQKPKSPEAIAKAKLRKEEDAIRKKGKKKRMGPKPKDEKHMTTRIKKFWREAPVLKDKKAPKFITEGLESDKEVKKRKTEPETFDDLRMPSAKQLKKIEKEKKKKIQKMHKKREKENLQKQLEEGIHIKEDENIIEGDYIPTMSEIEGIEGDLRSYYNVDETHPSTHSKPKLRLKLKPKDKERKPKKAFDPKIPDSWQNHDFKHQRSISDHEMGYQQLMEQQELIQQYLNNTENQKIDSSTGMSDDSYEESEKEDMKGSSKIESGDNEEQSEEEEMISQSELESYESDEQSEGEEMRRKSEEQSYNTDEENRGERNGQSELRSYHSDEQSSDESLREQSVQSNALEKDIMEEKNKKRFKMHINGSDKRSEVEEMIGRTELQSGQDIRLDKYYKKAEDSNTDNDKHFSDAISDDTRSKYTLDDYKEEDKNCSQNKSFKELPTKKDDVESDKEVDIADVEYNDSNKPNGDKVLHESKKKHRKHAIQQKKEAQISISDADDFDEIYDGIRDYINKETETGTESEREKSNLNMKGKSSGSDNYETDSDSDYVWDKKQKTFTKQRRKKKIKKSAIEIEGVKRDIETKDKISNRDKKQDKKLQKQSMKLDSDIEQLEKHWKEDFLDERLQKRKVNLKSKTSEKMEDLGLAPTGTVVDEKLADLFRDFKELAEEKNNTSVVDDIGQLLFNDDDEFIKIRSNDGNSDENEDVKGSINNWEKEINLKDYENYQELKSERETDGNTAGLGNMSGSQKIDKEVQKPNSLDSEETDSSEDVESAESYREEFDVALQAGLRPDRIRVFDRSVTMYADQDHQKMNVTKLQRTESSFGPKTLSDIEYESSKKIDGFSKTRSLNDDILVSTEADDPKPKKRKEKNIKIKDKTQTLETDNNKSEVEHKNIDQTLGVQTEPRCVDDIKDQKTTFIPVHDVKQDPDAKARISNDIETVETHPLTYQEKEGKETKKEGVGENVVDDNQTIALESKGPQTESESPEVIMSQESELQDTKIEIPTSNLNKDRTDTGKVSPSDISDTKPSETSSPKASKTKLDAKDLSIFDTDEEDEDEDEDEDEEKEPPKNNEHLQAEWREFLSIAKQSLGDQIPEMPDHLSTEEDESDYELPSIWDKPGWEKYEKHLAQRRALLTGVGDDKSEQPNNAATEKQPNNAATEIQPNNAAPAIQPNNAAPAIQPIMEDISKNEKKEEEREKAESNQNLIEEPFKLKKGINEYLEEDKWELWYRFIALMNNNQTRTYDNAAALFKAKKQEILTRHKAPIPPWEEPGISEYESDRRKLQREWEKTERYSSLRTHKFHEFLQDHEGEPKHTECDSELEDTIRTVFNLINLKDYDYQKYKDSLSREELAEILSDNEVEQELKEREERKQGKDVESQQRKAQESGDRNYTTIPSLNHPQNALKDLMNNPKTEFSQYDETPEWIKNNPLNPLNYKIYSDKMKEELGITKPLNAHVQTKASAGQTTNSEDILNADNTKCKDSQTIGSLNMNPSFSRRKDEEKTENDGTISEISKTEQAKRMWQHFQHLMKERHEENIENFLSQHGPIKKGSEHDARFLWRQYAAFATGEPMPERSPEEINASVNHVDRTQFRSQSYTRPAKVMDSNRLAAETTQADRPSETEEKPKKKETPSKGWTTLIQRIQAMKMDPSASAVAPPQQMAPGPNQGSFPQGNQISGDPSQAWDPQRAQYYTPQGPYTPGPTPPGYPPQQSQGQFTPPYGSFGQGYDPPLKRAGPSKADAWNHYTPPMYQNMPPGYNYQGNQHAPPPPVPPQPPGPQPVRGLDAVNRYHQNQQLNYPGPYGAHMPPSPMNRPYNGPQVPYGNPYTAPSTGLQNPIMLDQQNAYVTNRSRIGWPGDQSDKFHNRKYFIPDMGGQQTYFAGDPSRVGDDSSRYQNISNFRNPNLGFRNDIYPPAAQVADQNGRSIRWWQSGTRPFASSGAGVQGPPATPRPDDAPQDHTLVSEPREDSTWTQNFSDQKPGASQPDLQSNPGTGYNNTPLEE